MSKQVINYRSVCNVFLLVVFLMLPLFCQGQLRIKMESKMESMEVVYSLTNLSDSLYYHFYYDGDEVSPNMVTYNWYESGKIKYGSQFPFKGKPVSRYRVIGPHETDSTTVLYKGDRTMVIRSWIACFMTKTPDSENRSASHGTYSIVLRDVFGWRCPVGIEIELPKVSLIKDQGFIIRNLLNDEELFISNTRDNDNLIARIAGGESKRISVKDIEYVSFRFLKLKPSEQYTKDLLKKLDYGLINFSPK